jgi:very-short-patch-repair endonuclease
MEDLFPEFCLERDLPMPETNALLETNGRRFEVDCVWRGSRLIVEFDSRQAHDTGSGFEDDRARDRALIAAEWRPMRVTWSHLRYQPDQLEAEVRAALGPDY